MCEGGGRSGGVGGSVLPLSSLFSSLLCRESPAAAAHTTRVSGHPIRAAASTLLPSPLLAFTNKLGIGRGLRQGRREGSGMGEL